MLAYNNPSWTPTSRMASWGPQWSCLSRDWTNHMWMGRWASFCIVSVSYEPQAAAGCPPGLRSPWSSMARQTLVKADTLPG